MAKKKKLQLKPGVARGFATQSVPKKVVDEQLEPGVEAESSSVALAAESASASQAPLQVTGSQGTSGGPGPTQVDEFDADKAEEQSLQNLVDKFQERTEKEVVRTVKVSRIMCQLVKCRRAHEASGYRAGPPFLGNTPFIGLGRFTGRPNIGSCA